MMILIQSKNTTRHHTKQLLV